MSVLAPLSREEIETGIAALLRGNGIVMGRKERSGFGPKCIHGKHKQLWSCCYHGNYT